MTVTKETNYVNLQSLVDLAERAYYNEKKDDTQNNANAAAKNVRRKKITPKTP